MSLNGFVFGVISVQFVPRLEAAGLATAAAVWVASMKGVAQFGSRVVEIVFARNLRAITVGSASCLRSLLLLVAGTGSLPLIVAFTLVIGASQGVITIVRGAVPLVLSGGKGYGDQRCHSDRVRLDRGPLGLGDGRVSLLVGCSAAWLAMELMSRGTSAAEPASPSRQLRLLGRLDRQLARRAQRDGVDAVLPEPRRDRLAVQGPDPALLRLLGIVGQLPESRPELALERRRRPLGGIALRHLPLAVEHVAVRGPLAIGEDAPEQQQRLALERVPRRHEVVLELDDERVDVDLLALERELARLPDGVALGVELGEPHPRLHVPLGAGPLIQHHESCPPLGVPEEPDGGFEGLVPLGQGADLGVALRDLPLERPSRSQHHLIRQVDAARTRSDEDQRPEDRACTHGCDGTPGGADLPPTS